MVNSPDYIAFRAPNGPGLLTFVAALVPGERGSFPWAKWYSESAPNGEFRKVPGGYVRFAVSRCRSRDDDRYHQSRAPSPR